MLKGVFVGVCWLEEPSRVKEETRQFFKRRFEEVEWERPRLDGVRFKSIGQQDNDLLVACFEEEEVRAAVLSNGGYGGAMAVWRGGFLIKCHQIAVALRASNGGAMTVAIGLTVVAEW